MLYKAADDVIGALVSTRTNYHEFYAKKVMGGPVDFTEDEAVRLGIDTGGWPWDWEGGSEAGTGLVGRKIGRWEPGLETVEEGYESMTEESNEDDYEDDGDFMDEGEEEELEESEW